MKNNFPTKIPVFPLSGVIYFPKTNLPLNIFEQRYLDLVNDTIKKDKFMGIVQAKDAESDIYKIGCLGKISNYEKTKDGRMLINLTGITRFEIKKEIFNQKKYREFEVLYEKFNIDCDNQKKEILKEEVLYLLLEKSKKFFNKNGLILNWQEFKKLELLQQINTISMIAPVSNEEKQKLLETITLEEKLDTLISIIEFYLHDNSQRKKTLQ
tara:strand:+ start:577 stop:1209 length:633 start_codon:yes stop_codon:yes gene_type:complete